MLVGRPSAGIQPGASDKFDGRPSLQSFGLCRRVRRRRPEKRNMSNGNRALNSSKVVNIEDLRHIAQRRLPRSVFDYLDGGAEGELTLAENCRAFRDVTFRPRGAVAAGDCDLK